MSPQDNRSDRLTDVEGHAAINSIATVSTVVAVVGRQVGETHVSVGVVAGVQVLESLRVSVGNRSAEGSVGEVLVSSEGGRSVGRWNWARAKRLRSAVTAVGAWWWRRSSGSRSLRC